MNCYNGVKRVNPDQITYLKDDLLLNIGTTEDRSLFLHRIEDNAIQAGLDPPTVTAAVNSNGKTTLYAIYATEFADDVDFLLPARMMVYIGLQYIQQAWRMRMEEKLKELKKTQTDFSEEDLEDLKPYGKKNDPILGVIGVVLYIKGGKWTGKTSIHEMIPDFDLYDPDTQKLIEDFHIHVIVPHDLDNLDQYDTETGAILKVMKASGSFNRLKELVDQNRDQFDNLSQPGKDVIAALTGFDLKGEKTMPTIMEQVQMELDSMQMKLDNMERERDNMERERDQAQGRADSLERELNQARAVIKKMTPR